MMTVEVSVTGRPLTPNQERDLADRVLRARPRKRNASMVALLA